MRLIEPIASALDAVRCRTPRQLMSFCGAPPPTEPTAARAAARARALGGLDPAIELDDPRIGRGALVDLAREHDRRRWGAADH